MATVKIYSTIAKSYSAVHEFYSEFRRATGRYITIDSESDTDGKCHIQFVVHNSENISHADIKDAIDNVGDADCLNFNMIVETYVFCDNTQPSIPKDIRNNCTLAYKERFVDMFTDLYGYDV